MAIFNFDDILFGESAVEKEKEVISEAENTALLQESVQNVQDYAKFCAEIAYNQAIFESTTIGMLDIEDYSVESVNEGFGEKIKSGWNKFKEWVKKIFEKVKQFLINLKNKIVGFFKKGAKKEEKGGSAEPAATSTGDGEGKGTVQLLSLERLSQAINKIGIKCMQAEVSKDQKQRVDSLNKAFDALDKYDSAFESALKASSSDPDKVREHCKQLADDLGVAMKKMTTLIEGTSRADRELTLTSMIYDGGTTKFEKGETVYSKLKALVETVEVGKDKAAGFKKRQKSLATNIISKAQTLFNEAEEGVKEIDELIKSIDAQSKELLKKIESIQKKAVAGAIDPSMGTDLIDATAEYNKAFAPAKKSVSAYANCLTREAQMASRVIVNVGNGAKNIMTFVRLKTKGY